MAESTLHSVAMDIGICVQVQYRYDRSGRSMLAAKHKRDRITTWKVVEKNLANVTTNEAKVVKLWMDKFTGPGSAGYTASYKIAARGVDHESSYFILVPIAYH